MYTSARNYLSRGNTVSLIDEVMMCLYYKTHFFLLQNYIDITTKTLLKYGYLIYDKNNGCHEHKL